MHQFIAWLAAGLLVLGLATSAPTLPEDPPDPTTDGGGASDPDG